jgi:hypothetical protein
MLQHRGFPVWKGRIDATQRRQKPLSERVIVAVRGLLQCRRCQLCFLHTSRGANHTTLSRTRRYPIRNADAQNLGGELSEQDKRVEQLAMQNVGQLGRDAKLVIESCRANPKPQPNARRDTPGQSDGIRTQSPTLVVVTPLILRRPERPSHLVGLGHFYK